MGLARTCDTGRSCGSWSAGLAPGDYLAFLEYASRLVLLRRRGGGYEFVHRLLQDYFADLEPAARSLRRGAA